MIMDYLAQLTEDTSVLRNIWRDAGEVKVILDKNDPPMNVKKLL